MTIVNVCSSVKYYPFVRLSKDAIALIETVRTSDQRAFPPKFGHKTLVGLLECYLDLQSVELDARALRSSKSDALLAGFIGALRSSDFIELKPSTQAAYVGTFRRILTRVQVKRSGQTWSENTECDLAWSVLAIEPSAARYWRGWPAHQDGGHSLHLHWVWKLFSEEHCEKTHKALMTYWSGRKNSLRGSATVFNSFFFFSGNHYANPSVTSLTDGGELETLIRHFCEYYFTRADAKNLDIGVAQKLWNDWRHCVVEALIKSKTWPRVVIPHAGPGKDAVSNWVGRDDSGRLVKEKFLIPIPIEVSDEEALSALTGEVHRSVEAIVAWSARHVSQTMEAYKAVKAAARSGNNLLRTGRIIGNDVKPSQADLCATFLEHGISMFQRQANFVGVTNFTALEAARALAIPIWNTLDPFLYLLLNEHQDITPAFLLSIDLCDESHKETGIRRTNEGYDLIGYKRRRGATLAEQVIPLNENSLKIVRDIIAITEPLRAWMRDNENPAWKKLLLSCSRGLSSPATMVPASGNRNIKSRLAMRNSLAPFYKGNAASLERFCDKISLASVRATVALSQYLKDGDEVAFAHRLGHKRHNPRLMDCYLPRAFRNYMKSRTVLITQTLIVAQAMKHSPLIISATGFDTLEQLDSFCNHHKLRAFGEVSEAGAHNARGRILININPKLLGQLAALQVAIKTRGFKIKPKLIQWIEFGRLLLAEGKRLKHEPKLQEKICTAERFGTTAEYLDMVRA